MNTQVQTSYRPQIAAGLEGMIAEMTGSEVGTRICETAAGIGFGKAVSQGTGYKGCIIAGSAFVGLSVRDIALGLAPVDPLSDTANTLDKYGLYTNVAVMSRGHMWVKPQGAVAAGAAVYYDTTSGQLGGSGSGLAASGWIKFARQPVAEETLVINGATMTFKAKGTSVANDQANLGDTLGDTVANLVTALNASSTGGFSALTYAAEPPTPVGGGSGADTVLISDDTVGTAGNSVAITSGPASAGMTKSAATLLGGTASATLITGAKWVTSAIAGQLAIVSLGIQG